MTRRGSGRRRPRYAAPALLMAGLLVSCAETAAVVDDTRSPSPPATMAVTSTARILLGGDVMLGRGIGPIAANDGDALFADVRLIISSADLAAANLESPLTTRPHVSANPFRLEADPATATLLAGAGFDLMALANNHSGDAGPEGVLDTMAALDDGGIGAIGAGPDRAAASAPVVRTVDGISISFLAFDLSGAGGAATETAAGVIPYYRNGAEAAVAAAAASGGVVVVSLHGGIEYLDTDPVLEQAAAGLVAAGAAVVWGHGAHVVHPVRTLPAADGGMAVVATGLGNLLFDQHPEATRSGALLEVLVSRDGVVAYRTGRTGHDDLRVHFAGWDLPAGDAVLLDGAWWTPAALTVATDPRPFGAVDGFTMGEVVAADRGDLTGDGRDDLVVSFRRPYEQNPVNRALGDGTLRDAAGRSAHLGVFDPDTLRPMWVAGTLFRPVARVAVCDGAVALAFDGLDDPGIAATGGWVWAGFGFATPPDLPGPGSIGCRDIDGDGRTDPVVSGR